MSRPQAQSFRLGEADLALIRRLAIHLTGETGVNHSQADVIRLAVRLLGRREGIGVEGFVQAKKKKR